MFSKTLKPFLLSVALVTTTWSRDVSASAFRGSREQIVVTYDYSVTVDDVFDALEEANARFHRQLTCTRGFVVDVDEDGMKIIENTTGLNIGVSPHSNSNMKREEGEVNAEDLRRQLDGNNNNGFIESHECDACPGPAHGKTYVLTEDEVKTIKDKIKFNITTGFSSDEIIDCPFSFNPLVGCTPDCGSAVEIPPHLEKYMVDYHDYNPSPGASENCMGLTTPLQYGRIGSDSFDGSLADSAGALMRNVFHDAGTFQVKGNLALSGLNGT